MIMHMIKTEPNVLSQCYSSMEAILSECWFDNMTSFINQFGF